jgi:hypothetical protein
MVKRLEVAAEAVAHRPVEQRVTGDQPVFRSKAHSVPGMPRRGDDPDAQATHIDDRRFFNRGEIEAAGAGLPKQVLRAGGMIRVAVGVGHEVEVQPVLCEKIENGPPRTAVDGNRAGTVVDKIAQVVGMITKLLDCHDAVLPQWPDTGPYTPTER